MVNSPAWCKRDMNSPVSTNHIIPKMIWTIYTDDDLWPCKNRKGNKHQMLWPAPQFSVPSPKDQ